jgi:hypothetical protein
VTGAALQDRAGTASRRRLLAAAVLAAAVPAVTGGCATVRLVQVEPALFSLPPTPPGVPMPGRAAVVVPQAVFSQTYIPESNGIVVLQVPVGQIVTHAVVAALGAEFEAGATWLTARPAPGAGFAAVVEIAQIDTSARSRVTAYVPVPYPPLLWMPLYASAELSVSVGFDLLRFDAQGRALGVRRCDPGAQILEVTNWSPEPGADALIRLVHEAAAGGALIAARELRSALELQRMQPRTR